jgi:uncharacterized protein (TIGR03067 family)
MVMVLRESDQIREEAAREDLARLQGAWGFVAGRREAHITVSGDVFEMTFRTGEVYRGTLTLDPTCRPREMDLRIEGGPDGHAGKDALAIYQFDGDHLIWATGRPGTGERPGVFPQDDEAGKLCLIFRREA